MCLKAVVAGREMLMTNMECIYPAWLGACYK